MWRSGEAAPITDLRGVTPVPAPRSAARVTAPSSRRLFQRQLLPSGQMDSTAWTWAPAPGDPARGRKQPFIAGTPRLRLTPTRSAAEHSAAAGTRTPPAAAHGAAVPAPAAAAAGGR